MTVLILSSTQRWVLLGVVFILVGAVLMLRRLRRSRGVVPLSVAASIGASVVVTEQLIAWVVNRMAPQHGDFNEFRWVLLAPWGRLGLVLGVAVAVAVVVLGWRASMRVPSPWHRAALISLRTAAACTALVLFLEPAIELRQVAREPNRVAVLVDDSLSMGLRDEPGGPTRLERARALLDASADSLERWRATHRLDFYEFAETLVPSGLRTAAAGDPHGQETLMRQALEQIRARYEERELAGVVMISDGVATGGLADDASEGAVADFLRSLATRVHTVWAGHPGLKDVAVAKILADEFAFVRTVVRIEVIIRATGYPKRRIPVTLSSDGKELRHKWIEVGPGDTQTKVVFEISPPRVGKYVYEISTPVAPDEAVPGNNQRSFVLRVIRDKIRVLQVAGQPSWDVRALRRMLKQNPNVDLISFFILRTVDDHSAVPNNEMSLIPFPTRELFEEELPSFDVIVLQDFEFAPYGIGIYLENIRSYVEGGGGLVMLGGAQSFSAGGYAGTPVAAALPVELMAGFRPPRETLDTRRFQPQLTRQGKAHPITALRYEPRDNQATWRKLPELEGVNLVMGAKEGATVLAVHPRLRARSGEPMPVMATGEYGVGRSLVVTTDSLWRWGFVAAATPGDSGRNYDKLWENAIRWLIQDPELRYLQVDSDAVEYTPGTPVAVRVRLLDRDYSPLAGGKVALEVLRGSDPAQTVVVVQETLQMGEAGDSTYELAGLEPGAYRARVRAQVGGKEVQASDVFLVRAGTAELDQPSANDALLRQIAAATGGLYLDKARALPADLPFDPPRIARVDRRADVELWSRPGLLFLAFFFLGLEWLLRQRSGYL